MLRKIRLTFAMICFVLITLLFLDFTGTLHGWFGWLAKIQFLPAGEGNTVTQNGEPLLKVHRRHAARKTQGCYRELMPTLEYVKQEQKQEKPSIRDQLRTAAKQQPEKKSPVKSKTHDMEL